MSDLVRTQIVGFLTHRLILQSVTDPRPTLTVNEEVKLELCLFDFFDDCIDTVHITMKLCPGNYYAHRLDPTPSDSAYCFGKNFYYVFKDVSPMITLKVHKHGEIMFCEMSNYCFRKEIKPFSHGHILT